MSETLRREIERLERKKKRKKKDSTVEHNIKIARTRLEKEKSRKAFILSQTQASVSQALVKLKNQQAELAAQIEILQGRVRYYEDFNQNRENMLIEADEAITRADLHLSELTGSIPSTLQSVADEEPTVQSVNKQWELLQSMMK